MDNFKIISLILFINICFHHISAQNSEVELNYLDTVTDHYTTSLSAKGVNDIIVYSEYNPSILGFYEDDNSCPKNTYIIWNENNIEHIRKQNFYYSYEYLTSNSDTIFKFVKRFDKQLSQESVSSKINKTRYINGLDCDFQSRYIEIFIISKFISDTINLFFDQNESNYYLSKLAELIRLNINKRANLHSKNKDIHDTTILNQVIKIDNEKRNQRNTIFNNWINSSIPISENELEKEPVLNQKVYELYEYLMEQDTFICGENISEHAEYFVVPVLDIGQFKKVDKSLSHFSNLSVQQLYEFRPRKSHKSKKYLYMNKAMSDYCQNFHCESASFSGILHSKTQLMSGTIAYFESPPVIRKIYFNQNYKEVYIGYEIDNSYKNCLLKKQNKKWELSKIGNSIEYD